MTDKVNLEALKTIHLENFLERDAENPEAILVRSDLNQQDIADLFRGADVYYDAKTGTLMKPDEAPRSLVEEAAWIEYIRSADTGGGADGKPDGYLDANEAYVAVKNAGLSEEEAKEVDPQAFLKSVQDLIDVRYSKIAKNLNGHRADLLFKPMLDYLKMYNKGILVDQIRHSEEVLPLNGLTKSGANVVMFPVAGVHNIFTKGADDWSLMVGDHWAAKHSFNTHNGRLETISRLEAVIEEGVKKDEKWALDGDFKTAVSKLSESDQAVINKALVGQKFFDILTTADEGERNHKLLSFAQDERPGFIGIGSGNSERGVNINFWNYTGSVNNLYASRGILSYLTNKAQVWHPYSGDVTEEMLKNGELKKDDQGKLLKLDAQGTEALQSEARDTRLSILGDGGGFGNFLECHTPFLGIDCRSWGDEAKMGIPGRVLEIGVTAYLGYKSVKAVGDVWELGRLKGPGEPFRVWWKDGLRKFKPVPFKALKEARKLAVEEAAEAVKDGTALPKQPGRLGRAWATAKEFLYQKTLGKLPVLSEAQKAQIAATAGKAPGRGMVILTDATIVLGIVKRTDKKASAYFNPFELNYELDLSKRPDPTKPDPILSAAPEKK